MNLEKKNKYRFLDKKLLRLRINPLNANKFLKLIVTLKKKKLRNKTISIKRFVEVGKQKNEKWSRFIKLQERAHSFFRKFRPYTFNLYNSSKFAGQGNSFKKKFKKDLLTKKTFNYFYGGLRRKPLKKRMTQVYRSKQTKNFSNLCTELFESRLDSVLLRARYCPTIKSARQLIAHKHVKVNKKIEINYSYILKQGDSIEINLKAQMRVKANLNTLFKERFDSIIWPMVPNYLNINYKTLEIIFGDVKNFDFSQSFNFKNENSQVVESHYRH